MATLHWHVNPSEDGGWEGWVEILDAYGTSLQTRALAPSRGGALAQAVMGAAEGCAAMGFFDDIVRAVSDVVQTVTREVSRADGRHAARARRRARRHARSSGLPRGARELAGLVADACSRNDARMLASGADYNDPAAAWAAWPGGTTPDPWGGYADPYAYAYSDPFGGYGGGYADPYGGGYQPYPSDPYGGAYPPEAFDPYPTPAPSSVVVTPPGGGGGGGGGARVGPYQRPAGPSVATPRGSTPGRTAPMGPPGGVTIGPGRVVVAPAGRR